MKKIFAILGLLVFTSSAALATQEVIYCVHTTENIRMKDLMRHVYPEPFYLDYHYEIRVDGYINDEDIRFIIDWNVNKVIRDFDLRNAKLQDNRLDDYTFSPDRIPGRPLEQNFLMFNKLYLPETLSYIGKYAFYNNSIKDFYIPESVQKIDEYAFGGASIYNGFHIPLSLIEIQKGAFTHFRYLKDVVIPEGVSVISEDAFYHSSIEGYMCLPSNLKSIEKRALCNYQIPQTYQDICYLNIPDLYCKSIIPPQCDKYAFATEVYYAKYGNQNTLNTTLHVPLGCGDAYRNAPGWNLFENIVETNLFPQ